jgi:peptidoglycan hydrolase-like protein with peptidoglycan-binding domain
MSALPVVDVARFAYNAGFRGADLVRMVAICGAESGYNPHALNNNAHTGDLSYGLAQVNMIGSLGPARLREFHIPNNDALFDAQTNLNCAHIIYTDAHGTFTDWSTFNDRAYVAHWSEATAAVAALHLNGGTFDLSRLLLLRSPMEQGDDVARCQHIVGCTADSVFGPITRGHVVHWQAAHGLVADGIVGKNTAKSFGWSYSGPA